MKAYSPDWSSLKIITENLDKEDIDNEAEWFDSFAKAKSCLLEFHKERLQNLKSELHYEKEIIDTIKKIRK